MRRRPIVVIVVALGVALVTVVLAVPSVRTKILEATGASGEVGTDGTNGARTPTAPGSVIEITPLKNFAQTVDGRDMRSARVRYTSTSGDTGAPTIVTGAVFEPLGTAPSGGWPVISFGHGTTGIEEPCAPSLSDSLLGLSATVRSFVDAGYAVALADYQGLGSPGVHPYTDAKTAGLNVIDAVRALRSTFDGVSTRWAAVGGSQGGGAVWAADDWAKSYAPELHMVGTLAISPAADVSGLVAKADAGTLTPDQRPALQAIIESLARLHPDIDRDDYRTSLGAEVWDTLSSCSGAAVLDRSRAAQRLGPADIRPQSAAASERLRALLQQWALPTRELSAPLFVWFGGADTLVDADWIRDAIVRQCQRGGTVQWQFDPSKSHGEVDLSTLMPWVSDRFAGRLASNDCT